MACKEVETLLEKVHRQYSQFLDKKKKKSPPLSLFYKKVQSRSLPLPPTHFVPRFDYQSGTEEH